DVSGQAKFTDSDSGGAGTDTLVATFVDGSGSTQTSNTAQETWFTPTPPPSVLVGLTPLTATDPTGGSHTVTARVTTPTGDPLPGRTVTFTVTTGPNAGDTGTSVTDISGAAGFTYSDSGGGGTDTI